MPLLTSIAVWVTLYLTILKTLSFLLNQSLHFHTPFRICMCISKEAPEYPHLPQEPAKFPKGPRQQPSCPHHKPCIHSTQCGSGYCLFVCLCGRPTGTDWYCTSRKVSVPLFRDLAHVKNNFNVFYTHKMVRWVNKLLSTCSDYRLQGTSNLLIEAKS